MPITRAARPKFKPPRETVVSWDTWRKGVNFFLRENELNGSELVQADNLLLVGSGVPTKRWGSRDFFLSSPTGGVKFISSVKNSSETVELLSFSDWGFVTKKSGSSYSLITGASWPSGSILDATQLGGNAYIVSNNREWVRYNFNNFISFATLTTPTGLSATNLSGASGVNTWSWRVTAVGRSGGETVGSSAVIKSNLPQNLTSTLMRVTWTPISAASGDIAAYNVYRGVAGSEVWVGGTPPTITSFDDFGTPTSDPFRTVPVANTTGGPKAKYIIRFQDRLVLGGIDGHPTRILISGRYPDHERFDWYIGGGSIDLEPDSGQNVTGLGIYQEKLVVFKENSVWQVSLPQVTFGQYSILDPQYRLLTASQGCSSHRSIVPMENDLAFSNYKGMYILRYEPQLLTVLNASEISAKVRTFFESLSSSDLRSAAGAYIDKKYILSFPESKKTIVFDRERLCFMGPWTTPFGISDWDRYMDSSGVERWVAANYSNNYVTEFSKTYKDDAGTPIRTVLKTKKEDFKDWTLFKTINEVYFAFKAIQGEVDVTIYIEDRTGKTIAAKVFSISAAGLGGSSGIGMDGFGSIGFGLSSGTPSPRIAETQSKAFIYKSSRTFQVEVRTSGGADNYELLGIKTIAIPQARGNSPSSWNVS